MILAYNCSNCLMSKQHSPPSHTIFWACNKRILLKGWGRRACWSSFRNFCLSWGSGTICGQPVDFQWPKKNCQKFITLFGPLLEWKLLVVIKKKEPKKTLHTQGRKQGRKDHSTLMCSTLGTLLPHISSPFCKAPTCKAFENVLAYLEGNTYAWISYMYKWGGSYAYL